MNSNKDIRSFHDLIQQDNQEKPEERKPRKLYQMGQVNNNSSF